jgi:uncharacterized protein YoxC
MVQGANGIDIAAVYDLLVRVSGRLDVMAHRLDNLERQGDGQTDKLNEFVATVNGHTRKLDELAGVVNRHGQRLEDVSSGLTEVKRALSEYHGSVMGQGILLTHVMTRVERIERHLNLDPVPL